MDSYSQFGEDKVISQLFPADYIGTYIDIGSGDPVVGSNTYLFYERGWRGVCIDPVQQHIAAHEKKRPEDIALRLAIGDADLEVMFYENKDCPSVSTTVLAEARKMMQDMPNLSAYEVKMKTMATLVREMDLNPPPDILSIDVEGAERAVLEGIPFELPWLPNVVVIEGCEPRTFTVCYDEWEHILRAAGYMFYAFSGVNNIYVLNASTFNPDRIKKVPLR